LRPTWGTRSEIRLSYFCFPTLCQRAPVPRPFPAHRPRLFVGRALDGMLAHQDRRSSAFHDALGRFGGSFSHCGGVFVRTHARNDRASDAFVAILARYRCVPFAVHVNRFVETRQDRFHSAAVTRRSFSRSKAPSFDKRCAALLPLSRAGIAHPIHRGLACEGSSAVPELPLRVSRAGLRGVAHPAFRCSVFRRPRLPSPRTASQRRASSEKRAPPGTADATLDD